MDGDAAPHGLHNKRKAAQWYMSQRWLPRSWLLPGSPGTQQTLEHAGCCDAVCPSAGVALQHDSNSDDVHQSAAVRNSHPEPGGAARLTHTRQSFAARLNFSIDDFACCCRSVHIPCLRCQRRCHPLGVRPLSHAQSSSLTFLAAPLQSILDCPTMHPHFAVSEYHV